MITDDATLWQNLRTLREDVNRPDNDPQRRLYAAHDRAVCALGFGLHPATVYAAAMKGGETS